MAGAPDVSASHVVSRRGVAFVLATIIALAGSDRTARAEGAGGRRPNVIILFADDLGALDVNCYGSKDLQTPNLDSLAARGVRFTQFYVGAPVCSPSRAALLTGRCPQRAGVPGNVSSRPGNQGMPTEQVTLAEVLRGAGYRTGIFGKWHLGTVPECDPIGQGFDEFRGHKAGCIDNYSHFFYWNGPPLHDLWRDRTEVWESGVHFSDIIVREARRFLTENKDRPFFMYVPFNTPHYPLQGQDKWREHYAKLEEPRRSYAAFVSTLDEKIGEILKTVDELGLRGKTLIVFMSDNGHSTEERNNFGGGNAGPYRGAKFSLLEGGIRLPCIASLPGVIPTGQVRGQFATSMDWFPTIASLCGAELPDRKIDGKDITAVLKSAEAPTPHKVFHWESSGQWAVRDGDWKLVFNARDTKVGERLKGDDKVFLSNIAEDVSERKNVAKSHPDVVARFTKLHEEWVEDVKKR
ncbi:MAG: sulfatase-like hydrolase/transferase [Phycisphaerae bacterium]|nr:sulfatase-like hydrolase/transferase [Phycisphaerae bacterium]